MPMYSIQANCVVDKIFYVKADTLEDAMKKAEKGHIFYEVEEDMCHYELRDAWETDEGVARKIETAHGG